MDLLLEHGHLDLVVRTAGERGDWFCAQGAVRELLMVGEAERAWAVMQPFAGTGGLPAISAGADILLKMNRFPEALALAHPDGVTHKLGEACRVHAEVLARAGRVDAAIEVLVPHLRDDRLLSFLVEMTEGQGRDEQVLRLITPLAEEARRMHAEGRRSTLGTALALQASVLERSGRVEEAITVLGSDVAARRSGLELTTTYYARLLARHGRVEELWQLATGGPEYAAFEPLVRVLEETARAEQAETLLREHIATDHCPGNYQVLLMELLVRQGRLDDAVEAVRPTFEDRWNGLLQAAVTVLAEHGRHEQALRLLEERSPEFLEESAHWIPSNRWSLMGESGRCREAIAEIEATPGLEPEERDATLAWLLAQDGRSNEAIDLLRSRAHHHATQLAELLIRQGRPLEALAAIPGVPAQREALKQRWGIRGSEQEYGGSCVGECGGTDDSGGSIEDPPF
ncbi:hypothetical protein [Streptomyces sp. WAC05374]|uniref:hypothetical protein n=1 Tax=Streptomyces sp. WAC05374 TaxID=2487420 RepID=UPI0013589275|nr:hypothetical protein [Streptomyces sp. WAC05374]